MLMKSEFLTMAVSVLCAILSMGLTLYIALIRYIFSQEKAVLLEKITRADSATSAAIESTERLRTRCDQLEKKQELQEAHADHARSKLDETREDLQAIRSTMLTKDEHERSMKTLIDAIQSSHRRDTPPGGFPKARPRPR
jgi:chromosome segregation ATPase